MTTRVRRVELPRLHAGQIPIEADRSRYKVVVAGRRFGKTRWATRACVRVALGDRWWKPDDRSPGRAWWIAPIYKLTNAGWDPLTHMAKSIPGSKIEIAERRIIFPNGGRVEIRSADKPDTLVAEGLDLAVLDEAGTMKPDAWKESVRPTLSDRRGGAIFIGTPKGYNWLYDHWQAVPDRESWARFRRPSWENPVAFPDGRDDPEFDDALEELGEHLFRQEYGAEFIDLSGGVFPDPPYPRFRIAPDPDDPEELVYLVDGQTYRARDCRRIVTLDPAVSTKTSADYTAIVAAALTPDGKLLVLQVVRERIEGPKIIDRAEQVLRAWDARSLHVESVAFQLTLFQEARLRGLPVQKLRADRDKLARALPLAGRLENGSVYLLNGSDWIPELESELRAFTGDDDMHDDQVDALAYAAQELGLRRTYAAY